MNGNRFAAEQFLNLLAGRLPQQGEILVRSREGWRYENTLGPEFDVGEVAGEVVLDFAKAPIQKLTLVGDLIIHAPKNVQSGRTYLMVIQQDDIGEREISWDPLFKWSRKLDPVLSTNAGAIDIISFVALTINNSLGLYGVAQIDFGAA